MVEGKNLSNVAYFKRLGTPIVAPATAPGGPVGVLRLSGPDLSSYSSLLGRLPDPGRFEFRRLEISSSSGTVADEVLLLYFKAPHSFTGEDVLEIQGHGVPALMQSLQERIESFGAMSALPGEFSFRAVMNGKMSLEKAEALQSAFAMEGLGASAASQLLTVGASSEALVSTRLESTLKSVVLARGRLEAAIDFPEAEAEQASEVHAGIKLLRDAKARLQMLLTSFENFSAAGSVPCVVICGRPNVGKSTLLNRLAGGNRALVSPLAGTTRDVIEIRLRLPSGREVRVFDTAGLRQLSAHELEVPDRQLEAAGIELSEEILERADLVVWVSRATNPELVPSKFARSRTVSLFSFKDLGVDPNLSLDENFFSFNDLSDVDLDLRVLGLIEDSLQRISGSQGSPIVSKRQFGLLQSALRSVDEAIEALEGLRPLEIGADSLREAESLLRMALGQNLSDDYIASIFQQFCLGK